MKCEDKVIKLLYGVANKHGYIVRVDEANERLVRVKVYGPTSCGKGTGITIDISKIACDDSHIENLRLLELDRFVCGYFAKKKWQDEADRFVEFVNDITIAPGQRLVGDMCNGYGYINTDNARKTLWNVDMYNHTELHKNILNSIHGLNMKIERVIYHDPATIVYWKDGTKTVVRVQDGDEFDPEKGLAMAMLKRYHGNDGSYHKEMKKWLPKDEK